MMKSRLDFTIGREFFWHRQLNMKGLDGEQIIQTTLWCAKKAQVGIVYLIKTKSIFKGEEVLVSFNTTRICSCIILDQSQARIIDIERHIVPRVSALIKKFSATSDDRELTDWHLLSLSSRASNDE